jgi:hypothetical protein
MMEIIQMISLYIMVGAAWTLWLEWYTVSELEHPYNMPWSLAEKLFHIGAWPYSFGLFVYTFIKDFFGNFFD